MNQERPKRPEQKLADCMQDIACKLDKFWGQYDIDEGFMTSWDSEIFTEEETPAEMANKWATEVINLTRDCYTENLRDTGFRRAVANLRFLSENLDFYLGSFWDGASEEEKSQLKVIMDEQAKTLLRIFRNRGYIFKPFELD